MVTQEKYTLSDFCQMPIRRSGGIAEIIIAESKGRPVRLLGFNSDANNDDFTIREEGFYYYQELLMELGEW